MVTRSMANAYSILQISRYEKIEILRTIVLLAYTYRVFISTNNTYFYRSNRFPRFPFSIFLSERFLVEQYIYISSVYAYDETTSIRYIFYFVYDNNLIKPACFPRSVIFSEDQRWTKAS